MKKSVIAVDIDDVLAVENNAMRLFANEHYGHTHQPQDYLVPGTYWGYWEEIQGVDRVEGARRYEEYLASGIKGHLEVMDGAVYALQQLKNRYELIIVTSREAHLVDITREWLTKYFPEVFKEIAFVAVWTGSTRGSKATICKELAASYLIDDNPEHITLATDVGVRGILFGEYGWHKTSTVPEDTIRCQTWKEVVEYFEKKHV